MTSIFTNEYGKYLEKIMGLALVLIRSQGATSRTHPGIVLTENGAKPRGQGPHSDEVPSLVRYCGHPYIFPRVPLACLSVRPPTLQLERLDLGP